MTWRVQFSSDEFIPTRASAESSVARAQAESGPGDRLLLLLLLTPAAAPADVIINHKFVALSIIACSYFQAIRCKWEWHTVVFLLVHLLLVQIVSDGHDLATRAQLVQSHLCFAIPINRASRSSFIIHCAMNIDLT